MEESLALSEAAGVVVVIVEDESFSGFFEGEAAAACWSCCDCSGAVFAGAANDWKSPNIFASFLRH